ncbi:alpha/beta hydrolase [Serratia marcescens]|uniref:alpha/beta hydrolase n=1 Tax=Serratia marcescens TaxID=615 RepID=UPI001E0AECE6|nr:prolyl oligopeptidase family serine peptidase [Serratia marcescens]MBN5250404.1 prolyl oligopeptidase family serine peptidase [Serratia marcescens]MBN5260346.1 prolyl oligopeptidase family serine peptidase [Serratia marcescens]MBN5356032.1 prolyl oligopeptidase family serine peptidase [Serratia marcescens]MCW6026074.1 prolyl oligopeptidase family serine peptidase [Serratia marcescens]MEE4610040.1 prolyl oligopeptidase family serine peptidase [Serratia marcescens]
MRVATGMLSVLALWSGLAMAQSAALTLPREDKSSIRYYLDAAVPGETSPALLVILQGSDCNSVRHIRLVTPMRQVLPAADLLTVEKYGIDDTLPYREEVPRQDCPDAFVQHDTPQRRVSDVTRVLQAVIARNGYQKVVVLGGSEGAVIASLVTASSGLVDATLAFSGGGRWFIDDVRHSVADAPKEEKAGLNAFLQQALTAPPFPLNASDHGYAWWHGMLNIDQLATLRSIKTPVLIVQGDQDRAVSPGAVGKMIAELRADGKTNITYLNYPALDHVMRRENGESEMTRVVADMRAWLEKQLR